MRAWIERFIRTVMRDLTYKRHYPATVKAVNPNGSISVVPDDVAIRGDGLSAVIRPGVPACEVTPEPGARCLITFAEGDPRRPLIVAWSSGTGAISLDGSFRSLARLGDSIAIELAPTLTVTGVVGGTQDVPNPSPPPLTIPNDIPTTALVAGVAIVAIPLQACIQGGNPKILA